MSRFLSRISRFFSSSRTAAMRAVAKLLALLMLAGAGQVALAQSCSVSTPGTVQINFPATIMVPRDASVPVGTLLSGWVSGAPESWTCSFLRPYMPVTWLDLITATSDRIAYGGKNYAVIKTNVNGVGIIAKLNFSGATSSSTGPRLPISGGIDIDDTRLRNNQSASAVYSGWSSRRNADPNTFVYTSTISLALIRTGTQSLGGSRISGGLFGRSGIRFQNMVAEGTPNPSLPFQYTHNISYSGVTFVQGTCQTPDVVFNMGSLQISTFQGAGTRNGNWKQQNFTINNCPAGMNNVSVTLTSPAAGWLDSVNKVFKLTNPNDPTTAQGIGIQLAMTASQTIPAYDTPILLNGYNSATGGSFTVPLWARYVKPATSTTVSAGRANGVMIFTMVYK